MIENDDHLRYVVDLQVNDRNTIIEIDKTIKNNLLLKIQDVKTSSVARYFDYGHYIIRSFTFISKHYCNNFSSFLSKENDVPVLCLLVYINTAREYLDISVIQTSNTSLCNCKSLRLEEVGNEVYCGICGSICDYVSYSLRDESYERCNLNVNLNITKALKEIEGKETVGKDIESLVVDELKKRRIEEVRHETIFLILKDKQLSKYYKSINSIYNKITQTPPLNISVEMKKKITEEYNEFESIYPLIKSSSRVNSINMKFVLYKILKRNHVVCKGYSMLRTDAKHQEHEHLWDEGCKLLSWI